MLPLTQAGPMADTTKGDQHFPPNSEEVLALLQAEHLLIGVVIRWMNETEILLPSVI